MHGAGRGIAVAVLGIAGLVAQIAWAGPERIVPMNRLVAHGHYLVEIAGCNDCHTAGYARSGGALPQSQWLMGNRVGWEGPWGTTYAVNLRLYMQELTAAEWVKTAHTMRTRPPMPWFALHAMSDYDLRSIYAFIRYLGPAGKPAPAALPPGQTPDGPVSLSPGFKK